jgi:hypothetical protein
MLMKVFGDNIHKALLADRCVSQSWELPSLTVLWHCQSGVNPLGSERLGRSSSSALVTENAVAMPSSCSSLWHIPKQSLCG